MSKTGESYTAARGHVSQKRDRVRAASTRSAAAADRPSDDKVKDTTGKKWEAWFSILDRWGARERKHGETVGFLMEEHHVPGWWAQSITVGYGRARGMRLKHQQANGSRSTLRRRSPFPSTFSSTHSSTHDREGSGSPTGRCHCGLRSRATRRASAGGDGSTRLSASFIDKGPSKSAVAVAHERLPDADEAETTKLSWRGRLSDLKSFLES